MYRAVDKAHLTHERTGPQYSQAGRLAGPRVLNDLEFAGQQHMQGIVRRALVDEEFAVDDFAMTVLSRSKKAAVWAM